MGLGFVDIDSIYLYLFYVIETHSCS